MPNKTMTKPAIFDSNEILEDRKAPSQVAVAPKRMKIKENPATKKIEFSKTTLFFLLEIKEISLFSLISAKEVPDIKEIYPGTKGSTHGDKKDINPAVKTITIEISVIFYALGPFRNRTDLLIQNTRYTPFEIKLNGHITIARDVDGFLLRF